MRYTPIPLIALLLPIAAQAATSQPDALPSAAAAATAAAALCDKPLDAPKLFDAAQGLAVDRSDAKNPKVVAFVGPSWVVPLKNDAAAPALVLDRGTGKLVARAHDVAPMPKAGVCYVEEWQVPSSALRPGDTIGGGYAMTVLLDIGGGDVASLSVQPGYGGRVNLARGATPARICGVAGKMTAQNYPNNAGGHVQAASDDGRYFATMTTQKNMAACQERFKEFISAMTERPESTRIWPADARPTLSGLEGWSATADAGQGSDVGLWNPTVRDAGNPHQPFLIARNNQQVFIAALMLHPYELPPSMLGNGLAAGRLLSSRPIEIGEWVGVEKVMQVQVMPAGTYYHPRAPAPKAVPAQARVLDLHRDVRRLMIRCQAPVDQYAKWSADFDKAVKLIRVPDELMEPIVVPLDPTTHKPAPPAPPKK